MNCVFLDMLLRRIFTKYVLQGIVLYLLFLISAASPACAQVSLFQTLTTRDGLPSNYVFDACEDDRGYLWLGTDKGLVKFDGFRWKLFTVEDGLPGNYVSTVLPAGPAGFWIVISSKGLYYFNINTGQTVFVTNDCQDNFFQTDKTGSLFFYSNIAKDFSGFRWVSPDHPQTIKHIQSNITRFSDDYTLLADFRERIIRVIPIAGKHHPPAPAVTLSDGWRLDTMRNETDVNIRYRKVMDGIYYSNSSVYYFGQGRQIKKQQLFAPNNSYFDALRYSNQTLVWNEKDGLYFLSDDGSIRHFTEKEGLGSNMVTDVHVLQNGRLLICTLGGGLSYKLPEGNAILLTDGLPVKGLSADDQRIYAAAGNQLIRLKLDDLQVHKFPLTRNNIQSVDSWNGLLFLSSLNGLTIAKETGGRLAEQQFLPLGAGISNVILAGDRLYAGTFGVQVAELKNNQFVLDSTSPFVSEKITPVPGGYASFNFEDGIQFCYTDGSKWKLTTREGLPSNTVLDVQVYRDSCWISTAKGLALFAGKKLVRTYTEKEGLTGNRCVYSFHDSSGTCWVVTDKYLGQIEGDHVKLFLSTPVRDRYNDYVHKATYIPSMHTLVTGTLRSIYLTRLGSQHTGLVTAPPSLEQVLVNGKEVTGSQFRIPLNYQSLTFYFRPLLINPFGKATIYYQLKGYDDNYYELKDSLAIHFSKLRSGSYQLVARTMNEDGVLSEEKLLCSFSITPPFWQTWWFITMTIAGAGLLVYGITTGYYRRKQRQREKERALQAQLEQERERISRELHDNLGSSLVTIIAQSDNIETKLRQQQTAEALKKVMALGEQSRDTMNMLRETIWAVQGGTHSFGNFVNRIRDFLQRTYAAFPVEYHCETAGDPETKLSPEQTLHLFRCIQECTQNIVKYAKATRAVYSLQVTGNKLLLVVTDNGIGFDTAADRTGNGLHNMQKRIAELQGNFRVDSQPGQGTIIRVEITL